MFIVDIPETPTALNVRGPLSNKGPSSADLSLSIHPPNFGFCSISTILHCGEALCANCHAADSPEIPPPTKMKKKKILA